MLPLTTLYFLLSASMMDRKHRGRQRRGGWAAAVRMDWARHLRGGHQGGARLPEVGLPGVSMLPTLQQNRITAPAFRSELRIRAVLSRSRKYAAV